MAQHISILLNVLCAFEKNVYSTAISGKKIFFFFCGCAMCYVGS